MKNDNISTLKETENKQLNNSDNQDFEVVFATNIPEDNITVITMSEKTQKLLEQAIQNYDPTNAIYSAYLNANDDKDTVTPELIDQLGDNPQSNLKNTIKINSIIRRYINLDPMIGKTYETLESNVNTECKISYNDFSSSRNKNKTLEKAKSIIEDFNKKIKLQQFLRNFLTTTYAEGTYCAYLKRYNGNYAIDYYPLGVAVISDYEVNGEPYLLIDIKELENRLKKTVLKNKNNKALFFKDTDEEIKNNYPPEVYEAYRNKEQYAKLNINYSGVGRIGNLNRKYGLSPLFRALKTTEILNTFESTDRINAKAKAKKIIVQLLNKEILGEHYDKDGLSQMAYSHSNFMAAWKQPTVVVTAPAYVKDIRYVEPKVENTNSETVLYYTRRQALALGITFLNTDNSMSVTTSTISIKELIKTIDKIMEQASAILNKWYRVVLKENGIDEEYAPTIKVSSSEQMEFEIRKALAEFMFTKLACSYESTMEVLGIDINDELQKRKNENEQGYSDIFKPHPISYTTTNSDNKVGNPRDALNKDKEDYDITRNNSK